MKRQFLLILQGLHRALNVRVRPGIFLGGLILVLVIGASAIPTAQAPHMARGMSVESWSLSDCMARAHHALQAEGYTITWTGSDAYLAIKGQHRAVIMCDTGAPGKVVVNIVVASGSATPDPPVAERDRLGRQMGNPATEGTGGGGRATYMGCFKDDGDRDLVTNTYMSNHDMTVEMCVAYCRQKGYAYAGVQSTSQCFCGNSYGKHGPSNNCVDKCGGNPNEICGGAWTNSIFKVK